MSTDFDKPNAHYTIVQPMFDELSRLIQTSVAGNFQIIMQYITPLFLAAMMLYIVFLAWEVMYSGKDNIMMESIKTLAVFTIVCTLMTVGGMYLTDIVPFVQSSGQQVAAKIIGQEGVTTGATIDDMINVLIDKVREQYAHYEATKGYLDSIGAWLVFFVKAILLFISGGAFVVLCSSYLMMAEMMVGILLSIGGIFIAFAAFPATRQMFTAWVGSCLNYIFLNIAYSCLFKILIDYINSYIGKNDVAKSIWGVLCVALVFVIGKFLLAQISTLMSVLTGGVGINGLTSATGDFIKSVASKTGVPTLSRKVGSLAKEKMFSNKKKGTGNNISGG